MEDDKHGKQRRRQDVDENGSETPSGSAQINSANSSLVSAGPDSSAANANNRRLWQMSFRWLQKQEL